MSLCPYSKEEIKALMTCKKIMKAIEKRPDRDERMNMFYQKCIITVKSISNLSEPSELKHMDYLEVLLKKPISAREVQQAIRIDEQYRKQKLKGFAKHLSK